MLEVKQISKIYKTKGERTTALEDISFQLGDKGFVVLTGKSGSGKSTLLNILGGLDRFDSGEVSINGKSTKDFKPNQWDSYRNTYVGFVFQEFYLIDEFTVGKNIALALELQGYKKEEINHKVDEILNQVDLQSLKDRMPNQISGGQKQRIAIARALVKNPQIILADEPTGNLDSETGQLILQTLKKLSETKLVIMVTHDEEFAKKYGDRIIELKDGQVIHDSALIGNLVEQEILYPFINDCEWMIKLPKGQRLSPIAIDSINQVLLGKTDPMTMTFSHQSKFIPQIECEKQKIDTKDSFQPIPDTLELTRAHLPFSAAFKLALSSLYKKKLRLFFMMLLFVISLVLVGISTNFMFYDMATVSNASFKRAHIYELPLQDTQIIYKNGEAWSGLTDVTNEQMEAIVTKYPGIHYTEAESFQLKLSTLLERSSEFQSNYSYNSEDFNKIKAYDVGDRIPLAYGKVATDHEVMITDYMASMMVAYSVNPSIHTIQDVIGTTFTYYHHTVTISGIVKTDYADYAILINKDWNQLNRSSYLMSLYYRLNQARYETYGTIYMNRLTRKEDFPTMISSFVFKNGQGDVMAFSAAASSDLYTSHLIGDSRLPESEDEIVLNFNYQDYQMDIEDFTANLSTYLGTTTTLSLRTENESGTESYSAKTYTIVGYTYYEEYSSPFSIMFYKPYYDMLHEASISFSHFYTYSAILSTNDATNIQFLRDLDSLHLSHNTSISFLLMTLGELMQLFKTAILTVGLVMMSFTSLLIYSFISNSIQLKQKQIGTLRAIGARGLDVSKIFITESMMIAIVSTLFAYAGVFGVVAFLNHSITSGFSTPIMLLYVSFTQLLIILILSILVIFMSTFFPIKRITFMKPIKAIKNLK